MDPTQTPNNGRKKRKAPRFVVAGAVVAAMFASGLAVGSTMATWSSSAQFDGGIVVAGDLDVKAVAASWWDVSPDRNDAWDTVPGTDGSQLGHVISNIGTWRLAAGDKVAYAMQADVYAEGDNLVAELLVVRCPTTVPATISITYEVYLAGELIVPETAAPPFATQCATQPPRNEYHAIATLAAPTAGQADGLSDAELVTPVIQMSGSPERATVVLYINTSGSTPTNTIVPVGPVVIATEQLRTPGVGNFVRFP